MPTSKLLRHRTYVTAAGSLAIYLASAVSCGRTTTAPPTAQTRPAGTSAADTSVRPTIGPVTEDLEPYPGWVEFGPAKNIGHRSAIARIWLDREGSVALTADTQQASLLWQRLDGSVEPRRTPFSSIKDAAVAAVGETLVVGVIDTATRLNIATTDASGDLKIRFSGRPADRISDVVVLPGSGKVVALRTTGAIEVLASDGEKLATFDERSFKPTRLEATGKNTFVSVTASSETGAISATFEHFIVKESQPQAASSKNTTTLERLGQAIELKFRNVISFRSAAISPNGKLAAVLVKKPKDTLATIDRRSIDPSTAASSDNEGPEGPAFATDKIPNTQFLDFADDETMIVRTRQNGVWKIDAKTGTSRLVAMRARSERRPASLAAGKYISSLGAWLHVLDLASQSGFYMGYEAFAPTAASVSPSANLLVATTSLDLFLHDRKRKTTLSRELPRGFTPFAVSFIDEQHLLVINRRGSATIVRLDDQSIVAAIDGPGYVTYVSYFPSDSANSESSGGMLAFGGGQGSWITAVTKDGFSPAAVIRDGTNAAGFFPSPSGPKLWTISYTILRTFDLIELREGVSNNSATKRGVRLQGPRPIGLTHRGSVIGLGGLTNASVTIFKPPTFEQTGAASAKGNGSSTKYFQLDRKNPVGSVVTPPLTRIFNSPNGAVMLAASNNSVIGIDATTLKPTWEKRTANGSTKISFSQDGEHAAIVSGSSAAIIDANTGEFVHRMCSPRFVMTKREPVNPATVHGIGLCD